MEPKDAVLQPRYDAHVQPAEAIAKQVSTVRMTLHNFLTAFLDEMVDEGVVIGNYKFHLKARHKHIPGKKSPQEFSTPLTGESPRVSIPPEGDPWNFPSRTARRSK